MRIAVIGAGSWGTAAALQLANNGNDVLLWARRPELAERIEAAGCNEEYLPGVALPKTVKFTSNIDAALSTAEALVLATPSKAVRDLCEQIKPCYKANTPLVLLTKGVENTSGMLLLDVVDTVLESSGASAVLSGPNHAEEVARGMVSATVVASKNPEVAQLFQQLFSSENFRVYTSSDSTGVQLCGAAKNIIALAAGMLAGSGYGDNTAAMLMTRGLAEISRLVEALGGETQTCMGLAGMGDLIVTCTSRHSRNRSFGVALAQGETLSHYEEGTHMVVEGALASKSVTNLAALHGVELPICEMVRKAVWEGLALDEMISLLMQRPAKPEFY
ncbi:MAG: NAD(P)-dependent glycerol-3-phosphate dehydrogenase [Coriobacteriales bacterium]|jgi:glycerol-3-phosphate dehydrogenase (NAD(P)+)|nr:NAD(P)-dependent glycerol-3-phosphate dehydrogenase [Coriobacteriales bacterium]